MVYLIKNCRRKSPIFPPSATRYSESGKHVVPSLALASPAVPGSKSKAQNPWTPKASFRPDAFGVRTKDAFGVQGF